MEDEWETIQPSSSSTQSDEDAGDVVVVTRPTSFDTASVFAPSDQESSPVFTQPPQDNYLQEQVLETPSPRSSNSSSSTPTSTEIVQGELPQPPEVRSTLLKASFSILSSWVLRIAYGIHNRIGFWSIASVAAFATVIAYGRQWQRRRVLAAKENKDQLALLINQKDEKIKQLLLQIDRMNEALSARRRVPVFRVVVDSPLMINPRGNWKPT
ncbi:hypothetical protein L1887_15425 [Cichorium endivia]|nr:hypothetical protein L1887_15425 [Cichorium endivia]